MKRRRFCWLGFMIPLGVILTPPVLWVLIVLVAPTNWARSHVIAALEKASGRSVQLDDLDVCIGGGVSLSNLSIGAPRAVGDPWLQARMVKINVSPIQLLWGRFDPTNLEVDGATLRVMRRSDGTLELADLVQTDTRGNRSRNEEPHTCGASKLKARLRQSRVLIIDQPSQTNLALEEVEGEGNCEGEGAFVASLSGKLNEGSFQFTAHFDRSGGQPNFEGQFRASEVKLEPGMNALRYVVPILAGSAIQMKGRMAMDVYLRGRGNSRESLLKSVVGQGNVSIDPIELAGTPLMNEVVKIAEIPEKEQVGALHSDFQVQDGRVATDRLTLAIGKYPLVATGWTDFGGQLQYQIKLDGIAERLPDQAKKFVGSLEIDLNSWTSLRLSGSVDRVLFQPNGPAANVRSTIDQMLSHDDKERLRLLGRRLRDKVLR
jgi:AsmA protein